MNKNRKNGLKHLWNQTAPYLVLLVLAIIGYTNKDSQGMQFAWLGLFLWVFAAVFIFVLRLIYFAQFVTPLPGGDGHWQGVRLLARAFFSPHIPPPLPDETRSVRPKRRKAASSPQSKAAPIPPSFAILHAGLLRPYQVAIVTTQKGAYVGPKGPGFVMLERKERIGLLVDLRRQSRSHTIQATTRDGIEFQANVTVEFQVKAADTTDADILYPYNANAVKQVYQIVTIDEDGVAHPWTDQPALRAAALALPELSRHTMDELLRPGDGPAPLAQAGEAVQSAMNAENDQTGITIHSVKISGLDFDDEIRKQQLKEWESRWEQKMKAESLAHQTEVEQLLKQARARAQVEMIERIAQALETMRQDDEAAMVQIITLRLIEAWEEAVNAGAVNSLVSQQIVTNLASATSEQIKRWSTNPPPPQISPSIQGGKRP